MNYLLLLLNAIGALLWGCGEQPATQKAERAGPAPTARRPLPVAAPPPAESRPCAEALTALVVHSSLTSPFKSRLWAAVEEQNDTQLTLSLHVATNGDQGSDAIIGWVRLERANQQLSDFTNDPENPVPLAFRRADWDRAVACTWPTRMPPR